MRKEIILSFLASLYFLISNPDSLSGQITKSNEMIDSAKVHHTFQRLYAVLLSKEQENFSPELIIRGGEKLNAYATFEKDEATKERKPVVVLYRSLIDSVVKTNEDLLAFIMAHEFAHHVLGHLKSEAGASKSSFVEFVYSREQELAADNRGMVIALAAGYSYQNILKGTRRFIETGFEYSSFQALQAEHPSWKERISLLDKQQADIWGSMISFEDGNLFLQLEQYAAAERCFRNVTQEFPSCYEAWSNLGYALLMQYCDALDQDDLKEFDIGHLMVGGFYRRPESLESQLRGMDEEKWWDAVGALREAIRLKPDLALAKANLGIAYLVRPSGKDIGQATKFFDEAIALADRDSSLSANSRLAIYVNAGAAELSSGSEAKPEKVYQKAESIVKSLRSASPKFSQPRFDYALTYNKAFLLARSDRSADRREAKALLEMYLKNSSPSSLWWDLAYKQYVDICSASKNKPETKDAILAKTKPSYRLLTTIRLNSGEEISLNEPAHEAVKKLQETISLSTVRRTNLERLKSEEDGVELLTTDRVLAIILRDERSPAVQLKNYGLGAQSIGLNVGMSKEALDSLLVHETYDFTELLPGGNKYRFYRSLGLAILIRKNMVAEFVIAQIPERDKKTHWK